MSEPASNASARVEPFTHTGRVRELLAIGAVNLLLKILTLGVYHFWAKTRVRRYVWSRTQFHGESFDYAGRGGELLLGYLIAAAVLAPAAAALEFLPLWIPEQTLLVVAAGLLTYPVLVFLTGFATFSSWRYRLSRTRWRGIRFSLSGRARDHGLLLLLGGLLTMATFGFYLPFMRNRLTRHLVENAHFGTERFRYDGQDDVLLRRYLQSGAIGMGALLLWGLLIGLSIPFAMRFLRSPEPPEPALLLPVLVGVGLLLLLLPTLAAVWLWYRAGELRHFVGHTRLAEARFALELSTGRIVWLYLSNLLLLALSLGLAYPWVVVRTARALAGALRMDGLLNLTAIEQAAAALPRTGEGLADALDLGSI